MHHDDNHLGGLKIKEDLEYYYNRMSMHSTGVLGTRVEVFLHSEIFEASWAELRPPLITILSNNVTLELDKKNIKATSYTYSVSYLVLCTRIIIVWGMEFS